MNQVRSEGEEKERKRNRKDRGQEADRKKKKGQQNKNISGELKQGLPRHSTAKVNKVEGGTPNSPSHRM